MWSNHTPWGVVTGKSVTFTDPVLKRLGCIKANFTFSLTPSLSRPPTYENSQIVQGLVCFAFFLAVASTAIVAPSNVDFNFVRTSESAPLNVDDLNAAIKEPFRSTANELAQRLI